MYRISVYQCTVIDVRYEEHHRVGHSFFKGSCPVAYLGRSLIEAYVTLITAVRIAVTVTTHVWTTWTVVSLSPGHWHPRSYVSCLRAYPYEHEEVFAQTSLITNVVVGYCLTVVILIS